MDKYIITVESNRGEVVCITTDMPILLPLDEVEAIKKTYERNFPEHIYHIYRAEKCDDNK